MIRFACPACGKVYKVEDDRVGAQIICKKCAALVVVPEGPPREVLYGVPLPPKGESRSPAAPEPDPLTPPRIVEYAPGAPAPTSVPAPPPVDNDDDNYEVDLLEARQRARRRSRARRKFFTKLALLLFFLAGIAVAVSVIRDRLLLVEEGKAKFR